jgi:hypothetical protein
MPARINSGNRSNTTQPAAPTKAPATKPAATSTPITAGWSAKINLKPKSYDAANATMEQLRRELPAKAFDVKTPATRPAGSFTSGVGAACQLKLDAFQPQMTASGYVMPYKMTVVYEDKANYFGGVKEMKAWSQLKGTDGNVAATLDALKLERQPDGKYVGTAFVTQKAAGSAGLREAAFAFNAQGKWDSNKDQNYRLPL